MLRILNGEVNSSNLTGGKDIKNGALVGKVLYLNHNHARNEQYKMYLAV
jgi:hypothetical protein